MASYLQKMILIALVITIVVPISAGHRRRSRRSSDEMELYLRDLCSKTDKSDVCWNIVKFESRRFNDCSDERDITNGVIELAMVKSKEIRDQLKQWHEDSNDNRLKEKYESCSSNYNDIDRDLQEMQRNLKNSDDQRKISDLIKDFEHELDECRREFGSGSFDPGHVGDRNNEIEIYLNLVQAAVDRLGDYFDYHDRH